MTGASSPRRQRWLAVGLLCVVVTALGWPMVQPAVAYFQNTGSERQPLLKELRRGRALAQEDFAIRKIDAAVLAQPAWHNLFTNPNPEKALLEMQSEVRAVYASSGIADTTVTPLPTKPDGPLTRLSVRTYFSTTMDHLCALLERLERHAPHFRVENLTVRAPDIQRADANPTLAVELDVVSYSILPVSGT